MVSEAFASNLFHAGTFLSHLSGDLLLGETWHPGCRISSKRLKVRIVGNMKPKHTVSKCKDILACQSCPMLKLVNVLVIDLTTNLPV